MNRLHSRLVLAMLFVALFSASVMVISQEIGARMHFLSLPEEVQEGMRQRREQDAAIRRSLRAGETLDPSSPPSPPSQPPSPNEDDPVPFIRGLAGVREYQRWASYIGVSITALLAAIAALLMARAIARPIERVSQASTEVASGNFRAQVLERAPYSGHEVQVLNRNFNQMTRALNAYETERRDMIASIAHDLRTPLTAMKLRLMALQDEVVELNHSEVNLLLNQADQLDRLIKDLRTLSLADAGRLSLQSSNTHISALIEDLLQSYQHQAAQKNLRLAFEALDDLEVRLDAGRLKQVLSNLLENALRVSPANGQVSVSLKEANEKIVIRVRDEGPGIPEDLLPHIFERYVKDKDSHETSGLGLAIARTLVHLQGGTISAYNEGPGASFIIKLPL